MDERIAIGVAQTGTFVPASRTDAREYIEAAVASDLSSSTLLVKNSREDLARQIRASLNTSNTETKVPTSG